MAKRRPSLNLSLLSAPPPWLLAGTALLAGASTVLAYAPFNLWPTAIAAPVLLLWSLYRAPGVKRALFYAWLFGAAHWLCGMHWVFFSINEYGGAHWSVAGFLTLLLTLSLGLFQVATVGLWLLARRINHSLAAGPTALDCVLLFPCCWTLVEWIKGWLFTGLPWLDLGLTSFSWWAGGLLPVVGVRGLSPLLLCVSGLIFLALVRPERRQLALAGTAFAALALAGLVSSQISWSQPTGQTVTARIVQTNLTAWERWASGGLERNLQVATGLSFRNEGMEQLVLWPEVTLPTRDTTAGIPELLQQMGQRLEQRGQALALGILHEGGQGRIYNAIRLIGTASGLYLKSRLVPFGEFYPVSLGFIVRLMGLPLPSISAASDDQELLQLGDVSLLTLICYEVIYPDLVLPQSAEAGLILSTSNDSWFGQSLGPWQHLRIAQVRAAETGRWLLRSTNGGIGGAIDERGALVASTEPFAAGALSVAVPVFSGKTPAMRMPVWLWALLSVLLAGGAISWRRHDGAHSRLRRVRPARADAD